MKRTLSILIVAAVFALSQLRAQAPDSQPAPTAAPTPEESFQQLIQDISAKDLPEPDDYRQIAEQTVALGTAARQAGTPLQDSVVHDALDAVRAGRDRDADAADWNTLEEALEALLEKPEPPPEQEQQQNDQNQQGEQNEESESSQENGDKSDQEKSDESQQQQQDGDPSETGDQGQGDQQPGDGEQQQGQDETEQRNPIQDGAQMGDLEDQQDDQQSPQDAPEEESEPQQQMQTVGGREGSVEERDAETALLLQKLERLKQQDDPSKLFRILQEAQSDEPPKQQPNAKDW